MKRQQWNIARRALREHRETCPGQEGALGAEGRLLEGRFGENMANLGGTSTSPAGASS